MLLTAALTHAGSLGPGPWSSGSYYPGGADGKYQAAVYGNNITGVIGFALREGSPTVLQQTNTQSQQGQQLGSAASSSILAANAAAQVFDATQNYFVIFVEGRTYSGLAVGSVNPVGKTVTGALLGAQPDFGFVTNTLPFEFPDPVFRTNTNVTLQPVEIPTLLTNTNITTFTSPTNTLVTNTNVTVIGFNNEITITNLPGTVVTNITNIVSTNFAVTNIGPIFITNITYSTNIVTNIVTTDPIYITNTNQVPLFSTNVTITPVAAGETVYVTNTNVTPGPNLITNQLITNVTEVNDTSFFSVTGGTGTTNVFDPLPILNRGLSGGFQAKLKNNQAFMTFRGTGELSTPAQLQTVDLATNAAGDNISGTIETHTVSFKVDGLRTSFLTSFAPSAPSATTGQ